MKSNKRRLSLERDKSSIVAVSSSALAPRDRVRRRLCYSDSDISTPVSSPECSSPSDTREHYVKWMQAIQKQHRLSDDVLIAAVQFADSFFGLNDRDKEEGELRESASTPRERDAIAGAALLIADKQYSLRTPGMNAPHFLSRRLDWHSILAAERLLIGRLEWNLHRPSPLWLMEARFQDPDSVPRRRLREVVILDPDFPNMTIEQAAERAIGEDKL